MQQTASYASPQVLLHHSDNTFISLVGNKNCATFTHTHLHYIHYVTLNFKFDTD